jgi:hypothetical protein
MYEPLMMPIEGLTTVRILLTICAFEFFGPCIRDSNRSHLLNPHWVGHARFHLMWQLGFMFFSGIATLALIWLPDPLRPIHLLLAAGWMGGNLFGFWVAVALVRIYKGLIVVPGIHRYILGVEENVFVFSVLTLVFGAALAVYGLQVDPQLAAMPARLAVAP